MCCACGSNRWLHPDRTHAVNKRVASARNRRPDDRSPRAVHEAFKLWSHALGQQLVGCGTSNVRVPSVSALSQDGKTLRVWLQTKPLKPETREVTINIAGFKATKAEAVALTSSDTETDPGRVGPQPITKNGQTYNLTLAPYSLTMVTLTR